MQSEQRDGTNTIEGIISVIRRGIGFFPHPDNPDADIVIEGTDLNTALHGDRVTVELYPHKKGQPFRGSVHTIIERARMTFVGTLHQKNGHTVLTPLSRRMYTHIQIAGTVSPHQIGMKAVVTITKWDTPQEDPIGRIEQILGASGEHEVEMQAIVLEKGFDTRFPVEVDREAEQFKKQPAFSEEDLKHRRDFRGVTTLTIDPESAKDFDDALSIKTLPNGNAEVGIHIADVSHYVRPGSAIDTEAAARGTSIYLVDRTIPMLPEVLSNDLCSLRPNVDRLAFSAVFTLDTEGEVQDRWFGETVIHSDKRFTYEEAQQILDTGSGLLHEELATLHALAQKLQKKRFKEGAIDFDQPEVKFKLDAAGKPIEVFHKERIATNMLIEDFMLLANREVALYVDTLCKDRGLRNSVFIYRIHDVPNEEKITDLSIFLHAIGYELDTKHGEIHARDINRLFREIEGTPEEELIKKATIRSMAKAVYSTKNIGHFGLSFKYYTHFTSPIRRYPDLMVHRILKSHLDGSPLSKEEQQRYERLAVQSSEREVSAVEAERESIKYKQVEYMLEHIGETFTGTITGVTEWGVFVAEEQTGAEGMIRLRDLANDFYELDSKNYRVVGERTGTTYTLGMRVPIRLVAADLESKTIDWALATKARK